MVHAEAEEGLVEVLVDLSVVDGALTAPEGSPMFPAKLTSLSCRTFTGTRTQFIGVAV